MTRLAAAVVLGITFTSAAAVESSQAATARAFALQVHRSAGHQSPAHHLQEARRALDRASDKATKEDRASLDALRSDFAALALAYANVPAGGHDNAATPAPTSGAADPGRSRAVPDSETSKPLAPWQQKYAEVERDLKAFETKDRAVRTRIDHVRTHVEMFYASALGKGND